MLLQEFNKFMTSGEITAWINVGKWYKEESRVKTTLLDY
jgi:hypothetical protein